MNGHRWTRRACLAISALALTGFGFACGGEPTETDIDEDVESTDTTEEGLMPAPDEGGGDCCSITCSLGSCSACGANGRKASCHCWGGTPVCET